ncbi:MAG: HalX domain-containing protein [Haloarculaceae archaeon]
MASDDSGRPTVLVVDDEADVADVHGDEVLARIRERDEGTVAVMTTAVDPDLNILEMEFLSTVSKLDVPESELPRDELADSEEYADLKARAAELVDTFRAVGRRSS